MSEIRIEIRKSVTASGAGETVTLYASLPLGIPIPEAERFSKVFIEAIAIAKGWQSDSARAAASKKA